MVCDEAVSALDVSIQAQIVDLIKALQAETGLALIFISHDLSVVRQLVAPGDGALSGPGGGDWRTRDALYRDPRHPYTRALLSAVPTPDPQRRAGQEARAADRRSALAAGPPRALTFLKSRRIDDPEAEQYRPRLIEVAPGHLVAEHD